MMKLVENVFVVIVAEGDVVLTVVVLNDLDVGGAFRNRHHGENEIIVLIICTLSELVVRQIAAITFTSLVATFANTTHVKLGG